MARSVAVNCSLVLIFKKRCGRFQKEEEGRGGGKGKPEGEGEKLWGLCLERFVQRFDKTEKAPSARAKQISQTP